MITIQIDGKTYKPTENFWEWLKNVIRLKTGDLEEVKENKETLYGRSIEEQIREHLATPSILEKLRNGLEKRKQKMIEENWWPSCIEQVVWTLAVLDSLETKEEPVPPTDKWREQYIADHPDELSQLQTFASPDKFKAMREQPQFTPWQMIEVSNDGEKWEQEPRKFVKNNPTWWYEVEYKWLTSMTDYFEYARPLQPQEDIELQKLVEIWDFDYMKITDWENYKFATLAKQVEALTKSNNTLVSVVNQLIKANKK